MPPSLPLCDACLMQPPTRTCRTCRAAPHPCSFVTFAEDASAEAVFAAGSMHDLGGKRVEVKPATPKGSGSLARPSGSSSAPPRPGGGGGGGRAGMGLPFGGTPGAVVGSPSAMLIGSPPSPYAAAGYGMYGFPHAGACFGAEISISEGVASRVGLAMSLWRCAVPCHASMALPEFQICVAEHMAPIQTWSDTSCTCSLA